MPCVPREARSSRTFYVRCANNGSLVPSPSRYAAVWQVDCLRIAPCCMIVTPPTLPRSDMHCGLTFRCILFDQSLTCWTGIRPAETYKALAHPFIFAIASWTRHFTRPISLPRPPRYLSLEAHTCVHRRCGGDRCIGRSKLLLIGQQCNDVVFNHAEVEHMADLS